MKPAKSLTNNPFSTFKALTNFDPARKIRTLALGVLAGGLIAGGPAQAQNNWTGGAGTTNWSTPGNWVSASAPGAGDTVLFDNLTAPFAASGVVDNIVDANFTINALQYSTVSTNGYHTTLINPGLSLNINGSAGNALWVQYPGPSAGAVNIYERFLGAGTLTVTNTAGIIMVSQGGDNNDHYATLDLSGLTNFAASVSQIYVGVTTDTATYGLRPMGIMRLADTNYIQTAAGTNQPGILVAGYPTGDTNLRGTEQMFLGRNNVISSDAITIGATKTTGQILSRPGITNGYALLRGSAGGADKVKLLTVGDGRAGAVTYTVGSSGTGSSGTFDATGTFLDALVQDLYVPRSQTNNNGATTGVLTYDQGSITADNAYVGYQPGPVGASGTFNATGTVNVNGNATLTVNSNLVLTRKANASTPSATLNLSSNATVNVISNIVVTGGTATVNFNSGGRLNLAGSLLVVSNGTATVNFNNGGIIDLQPAGDSTPGSALISTLTGSGTITNATTVTNLVALTPGGTLTAGTLVVYGNLALSNNAVFNVNLATATNAGGNVNDLVIVNGNVTLNNNLLSLAPIGGSLATGTYQILTNTGTQTGSLAFTNPTRYALTLTYLANEIDLTASGASGSVRWNSTNSPTWDITTSNWFNTGTFTNDRFLQLDSVLVDDSGAYTNLLLLPTAMFPSQVTVNSSTRDYFFGGSGRLSGSASLLKLGTSSLSVSNANDFTGAVVVSNGILRTVNGSALGTTNGTTTVVSGATLDIGGQSFYNPGEIITIAGTGLNSTGAVINTGAAQNNAIRFLTLSDNATIRGDNRFDVRGPGGAGSFNGALNLNGFTLTKLGAAQQSLVDLVATNAGSIVIGAGTLGLTRSLVDGPGYINVFTNILLFENSSTGYVGKAISVAGGIIRAIGNALTVNSAITNLSPGVTIDASVQLTLSNTISGPGALTKTSASTLLLLAPDLCTGPTTISAGRLTVSTNSSLALTPSITVAANAFLDVSAVPGGFTLQGSQTLSGSGAVIGDVTANSGANLAAGISGAGTLSFSNNLTLNSVTNVIELGSDPTQIGNSVNDLITVSSNLTLNGVTTLRIQPLGPLSGAQPYTVMTYTGALTGGLANLQVTSSNPRYVFTLVDPATTPGSIQISVSGVPTTLSWRGGTLTAPTAWDGVTSNWFNGTTADSFFAGDTVAFDDTANTNLVTLVGTEQPGSMTVNNALLNYAFGGSGGLAAGSLTKQNSGSVTFSNTAANTISAGLTLAAGSLVFQNPTNTFSGGIVINGGTLTFNQPLNETVSTSISNSTPGVAGTLVLASPTTLTLSANNTNFDGPIFVNAGLLKAASANALGNNNGATTVASGATLDINGISLYNPGDDIIISGFGLSNTGAVINTGGQQQNAIRSLILSNNAAIASWTTANRWDVRGPGGSGSFSGNLDLNGYTLTKLGAGSNSIVDANVLNPGVINIVGGLLTFTRCSVPSVGMLNVSNNVLQFENYSTGNFSMPVTVGGGIIRLLGNAFSFDSPVTALAGGLILDNSSANNLTAAGDLTGPGNLTKTGSTTVVLASVNNAWSSNTVISAGTLQIGSGGSDGSLPDLPIINNGTLVFNSQNSFTNTAGITGAGALTQTSGGMVMLAASNSFTGAVNLNATTVNSPGGGFLIISNSYALGTTDGITSINGNTTGSSTLALLGNISVPETFSLSARQTVTVDIPHILNLSGTNSLTGPINGTTGGSAYNFQCDTGKLTVAGNFVPPSTAGTRNLKLMGDGKGEWSGIISNSADGLVPTVLTKQGAGTWTLSGSNVYFGSTTITAGTLALAATGSINSTPSIDVQSGALFDVSAIIGGFILGGSQTLLGNGSVLGNLTANGTVAPGESAIGTLTFSNNLVLGGTTVMEIDRLNAPFGDLIVASAVTYGGTLVVTNLTDPLQFGDTFTLFSAPVRTGSFTSITLPPLDPGLGWDTSKLAINGTIKVGLPVATNPTNILWSVSGNNLTLSWPQDHLGWTLLVQTNKLAAGVSANLADWGPVAGSTSTNQVVIPLDASKRNEFYKLAYPYP